MRSLREALKDAERLNKALKVGRVPATVLSVLQAIEDAGLGDHFVVVGTHALYAYDRRQADIVQSLLDEGLLLGAQATTPPPSR